MSGDWFHWALHELERVTVSFVVVTVGDETCRTFFDYFLALIRHVTEFTTAEALQLSLLFLHHLEAVDHLVCLSILL